MNNPLKLIREHLKFTVYGVAEEAHVDPQLLYHLEEGVYTRIPPKVLLFYERHNVNLKNLKSDYATYRHQKRLAFKERFPVMPMPEIDINKSPLTLLRKELRLKKADFIRLACVEPAVLYMVENGRVHKLPQSLRAALIECGMTLEQVNELEEQQYDFYGTKDINKQTG